MEIKEATADHMIAVKQLAALAQEHRLDVFRALVKAGNTGLAAGQIAMKLGLPASSLSFHLSHLRESGLVSDERQGRSIIYRANFGRMQGLLDYLLKECCADEDCTDNLVAAQLARKV